MLDEPHEVHGDRVRAVARGFEAAARDCIEQLRVQLADVTKPLAEADAAVSDLQFHAERDKVDFKLLSDKSTNEPAPATQPAN